MEISVIICTHNPRLAYLQRVLDSLCTQSIDSSKWELLLIDNCSEAHIKDHVDVSWHKRGKIIAEPQLGLTHARLRGIRESKSEILCFVDDDNVLDPGYLEQALKIGTTMPHIGCWGGRSPANTRLRRLHGSRAMKACSSFGLSFAMHGEMPTAMTMPCPAERACACVGLLWTTIYVCVNKHRCANPWTGAALPWQARGI